MRVRNCTLWFLVQESHVISFNAFLSAIRNQISKAMRNNFINNVDTFFVINTLLLFFFFFFFFLSNVCMYTKSTEHVVSENNS